MADVSESDPPILLLSAPPCGIRGRNIGSDMMSEVSFFIEILYIRAPK